MKKLLYGTTALVAAGMIGSGAYAADKIKLNVGGYYQTSIAFGDQDADTNKRMHKFAREGEVRFRGSTTLDNGIQFGAEIQLEAETCGDQIDESFVWVSGAFGRINYGGENSAPYTMGNQGGSSVAPGHGLNSPNFSHTSFFLTTAITGSGDDEKITYLTPRMAGFQLGVSYTPDATQAGNGGAAYASTYSGFQADNDAGEQSEIFGIGANYINKFGDVGLAITGGYETSSLESSTATVVDDRTEWALTGNLTYSGFRFGAGYRVNDRGIDQDQTDLNISISYGSGPWAVSLMYANQDRDELSNGEIDAFELAGRYVLGPGITLGAGIQLYDNERTSGPSQGDSTIVFLGTSFSF